MVEKFRISQGLDPQNSPKAEAKPQPEAPIQPISPVPAPEAPQASTQPISAVPVSEDQKTSPTRSSITEGDSRRISVF